MARRLKKIENIIPPGWLVTFSDLIMLLLTFFVMMLTMKTINVDQIQIGNKPKLDISPTMIVTRDDIEQAMILIDSVGGFSGFEKPNPKFQDLIEVTQDTRGIVLSLESDELFASGSAVILPDKYYILNNVAKILQFTKNDIMIMGHTDSLPVRQKGISNLSLSFDRAFSVLSYFTEKTQLLDLNRLAVGGYGDTRNRYPNDTAENRSKNRKVEFILKKPLFNVEGE